MFQSSRNLLVRSCALTKVPWLWSRIRFWSHPPGPEVLPGVMLTSAADWPTMNLTRWVELTLSVTGSGCFFSCADFFSVFLCILEDNSLCFQALVVYECLTEWGQILCSICPNPKLVITGGTSTAVCVWETGTSKERNKTLTLKQVKHTHKLCL